MIERKQKFNSGMGAILCNNCSTIISTGLTSDALFCEKCETITEEVLLKLNFKKGFTNSSTDVYHLKNKYQEIVINFEKLYKEPGFFLDSLNNNKVMARIKNTTHLSYLINFIIYDVTPKN